MKWYSCIKGLCWPSVYFFAHATFTYFTSFIIVLGHPLSCVSSKEKSYTFKNKETKFIINKDLSCNSKNIVYIIECNKVYIGFTQALNTRISFHKSNIIIPENRKLNVTKDLYECNHGEFKTMPIYETNDITSFQIKEKNFIDKFKPM